MAENTDPETLMPTASAALRAEWDGPGEETAMAFLQRAGYRQRRDWTWQAPDGHTPTDKELRAIQFLIDEWDMGPWSE